MLQLLSSFRDERRRSPQGYLRLGEVMRAQELMQTRRDAGRQAGMQAGAAALRTEAGLIGAEARDMDSLGEHV